MPAAPAIVDAATARRFLMHGAGLLARPDRAAGPAALRKAIEAMGFVQVDTIAVSERAHHHILMTRFDGYRPAVLARLLERDRHLFEHWTHDASIVPTAWLDWWRVRFDRARARGHSPNAWWRKRIGPDADRVLSAVLERVRREGPVQSLDFADDAGGASGAWWGWKPEKAALEHLWRIGELAVAKREAFRKVYDLTERVLPSVKAAPRPDDDAHLDWACTAALERLGAATPGELAAFMHAVSNAEAKRWTKAALARGAVVEVRVESVDGARPRAAVAPPDWRRRAAKLPAPPDRARVLSPFDPAIRDRDRAQRLFGLDYRFEAFVPAPKRRHGYYTLPVLDGERFVARLDPKLHRDRGALELLGFWWDERPTATKRRRVLDAIERYAAQAGATRVEGVKVPARR